MFETIIGAVAANTIVLAILSYLARSIIQHFLSKDIEKFKNKLELEAKTEIESYRSKLEKERIRLQISYGGIFEKQAIVIIEIYKLILDFEKKITSVMTPLGEDKDQLYRDFTESYKVLFNYYEDNRILLPKSFEEAFEAFLKRIYNAINVHKSVSEQLDRRQILERLNILKKEDVERLYSQQDKAFEIIDNFPVFKNNLSEKLRSLIGISFE